MWMHTQRRILVNVLFNKYLCMRVCVCVFLCVCMCFQFACAWASYVSMSVSVQLGIQFQSHARMHALCACPLSSLGKFLKLDHNRNPFKAVCVWVSCERNRAELICCSTSFGLHMEFFPNSIFQQKISSAVFFAWPTQMQTALHWTFSSNTCQYALVSWLQLPECSHMPIYLICEHAF